MGCKPYLQPKGTQHAPFGRPLLVGRVPNVPEKWHRLAIALVVRCQDLILRALRGWIGVQVALEAEVAAAIHDE